MSDIEKLTARLEAAVLKIKSASGSAVEEGETPPQVEAYNAYYKDSVQPFVDVCKQTKETEEIGEWCAAAWTHQGKVIEAAVDCAKPSNEDFLKFLTPCVKVITSAGDCDNRDKFFPQKKAFSECVNSLSWMMQDMTSPFVQCQLEAADMYFNKALMKAKDKEDAQKKIDREYVKTSKKMMSDLVQYTKDHFKSGITWKFKGQKINDFVPGKSSASSGPTSTEERLEGMAVFLEAHAASLNKGEDEEGTPMCVVDYTEYYEKHVQPFVDVCNKLEQTKQIGKWTEQAWKHQGKLIQATTCCKKPTQEELMGALGPEVEVITSAGDCDNRAKDFAFKKSYSECVQSLSWIMMPLPKGFITGQVDAASFYLNKVLKEAKDADDETKKNMREFVKLLKAMLSEMAVYAVKYFKTGLEWQVKGETSVKDCEFLK